MASPFLEERTDETGTDFLGRQAPLAFKGQPALPTTGGGAVGSPAGPVTLGGGGVAPGPSGAPEAPSQAAGLGGPTPGTIAAAFGPQLLDVAGRVFGSSIGPAGATRTPSGQLTSSAPEVLRDVQFGEGAFDPALVTEPVTQGGGIPSGLDDALGWATLAASILSPAVSLSGILGGGNLQGQQAGARRGASSALNALGSAYTQAAQSGDPQAVFAALGSREGGGSVRSELALPADVIASLGLPPSQAGRYDWAALSPQQYQAVTERMRADPSLVDQWVVGSGDVARLPEADALSVSEAAAQMARSTLRYSLGLPEPVRPDVAPLASDFERISGEIMSGGETGGPAGAPAGMSFGEGGRAFGQDSPLSSNVARAIQLGLTFAPVPMLGMPLSAARTTEYGLNQLVSSFPQLAAQMGLTGVDTSGPTPSEETSFTTSPTATNTVGYAEPSSPTGYVFGRAGVGAATGNAPPDSTNFGDSPGNTSGASPAAGTAGIGEGDAP